MRDPAEDEDLNQSEILRRLTALLLQIGAIDHEIDPESICEDKWRDGLMVGLCTAAAIAGGAGVHGTMPLNELASIGLDVARSIDWTLSD